MANQLGFKIEELSDFYALKTLYDYLDDKIDALLYYELPFYLGDFWFDLVKGKPFLFKDRQFDGINVFDGELVSKMEDVEFASPSFGIYSDIICSGSVSIDASILKNCVVTKDYEEKMSLRRKYFIDGSRPVVVIGFAEYNTELCFDVALNFSDYADVYLIYNKTNYDLPEEKDGIVWVKKYGVLKDYYAMADIALTGSNLTYSYSKPLHNFIEATENAPFHMVKSRNCFQYGFEDLAKVGVIVQHDNKEDLVESIVEKLKDPDALNEENFRLNELRAKHIRKSREIYLPVFLRFARWLLDGGDVLPAVRDLKISFLNENLLLKHPETRWHIM